MKVVILAGGAQSTINNEYEGIPKPMIDIGGRPLLWHIMKHFSQYGMNEFIICGGYRVDMIKEYFMDYYIYASDITVDLQSNTIQIHKKVTEDWKVTVVDTGLMTTPAQRISMIETVEDRDDIIDELCDRFGDVPRTALRLVDVALCKALAERCGIKKVEADNGKITFVSGAPRLDVWSEVFAAFPKLSFLGVGSPLIIYKLARGEEPTEAAARVLQKYLLAMEETDAENK